MNETQAKTETIETLRLLYPIFKEEVYRRRAAIARISRCAALLFSTLSVLIIFLPIKTPVPLPFKLLCAGGLAVALLLLVFHLIEEKKRHEKAKRQLITLEKAFGFFEEDHYLPNKPLYPSEWQDRPKIDLGLAAAITGLCGTGLVLILLILSI